MQPCKTMTESCHSRGTFENIAHCLKRIWHFGIISSVGFIGNELIASSSKPAFPGFEALGLWGEGREWGRRPPAGYLNAGQNYVFPKILDIFQWIKLASLAFVLLSCKPLGGKCGGLLEDCIEGS